LQDGYGADSDSGISDTENSTPSRPSSPLSPEKEKEKEDNDSATDLNRDVDLLGAFEEDFGFRGDFRPTEENDHGDEWAAMRSITSCLYPALQESRCPVPATIDLFSDSESVLFEDEEGGLVFGPEIPPELAEAGIPEIEDHGAIQATAPCR
jgi:hypothetical protein